MRPPRPPQAVSENMCAPNHANPVVVPQICVCGVGVFLLGIELYPPSRWLGFLTPTKRMLP